MSFLKLNPSLPWDERSRKIINAIIDWANGDSSASTPNSQTGTTYTFVAADALRPSVFSSASAVTVTIPTNASVAFPIGTTLRCLRTGAGLVTFSPDTGVTLRKPTGIRPNRFMGCLVRKQADLSAQDLTAGAAVTWNQEAYDTDGFHDNSTNPERVTIPSGLGIKKVSVSGYLLVQNHTSGEWTSIFILKNGSETFDGAASQRATATAGTHRVQCSAPDIACADTDYFVMTAQTQTDASVDIISDRSNFRLTVTSIDAQGTIAYQYGEIELLKIGTNEWAITGPGLG